MSIDIRRAEQLVSFFIELDDEDQMEILTETATRAFMTPAKKRLLEKQKYGVAKGQKALSKEEIKTAAEKETYKRLKVGVEILDNLDHVPDEEKAALYILLRNLAEESEQDTQVTVTVTQRSRKMKDVITELFPNVDYNEARKRGDSYIADFRKEIKEAQ